MYPFHNPNCKFHKNENPEHRISVFWGCMSSSVGKPFLQSCSPRPYRTKLAQVVVCHFKGLLVRLAPWLLVVGGRKRHAKTCEPSHWTVFGQLVQCWSEAPAAVPQLGTAHTNCGQIPSSAFAQKIMSLGIDSPSSTLRAQHSYQPL